MNSAKFKVNYIRRARRLDGSQEWGLLELHVQPPLAPTRELTAVGAFTGDRTKERVELAGSLKFARGQANAQFVPRGKVTTRPPDYLHHLGRYMGVLWHRLHGSKTARIDALNMWDQASNGGISIDERQLRRHLEHPSIARTVATVEGGACHVAIAERRMLVIGRPIEGRQTFDGEGDEYTVQGDYRALRWDYGATHARLEVVPLEVSGHDYIIEHIL